MDVYIRIRFYFQWSLVFSFCLAACSEKKEQTVSIIWATEKPVGVFIPQELVPGVDADRAGPALHIRLEKSETDIIGDFQKQEGGIGFFPVLPFTAGLKYEIYSNEKRIGILSIPVKDTSDATFVRAVYPTADTLPENLLTFYIDFSKPMQE